MIHLSLFAAFVKKKMFEFPEKKFLKKVEHIVLYEYGNHLFKMVKGNDPLFFPLCSDASKTLLFEEKGARQTNQGGTTSGIRLTATGNTY